MPDLSFEKQIKYGRIHQDLPQNGMYTLRVHADRVPGQMAVGSLNQWCPPSEKEETTISTPSTEHNIHPF